MKNQIKFISDKEAQVTKSFERRATIFGTDEYNLWKKCSSENPEVKMTTKTIRKNPNKKTNRNLTYKNIETFISIQENSEKLLAEFEKVKITSRVQKSPYYYVVDWFKTTFPNYDKNTIFKEADTVQTNLAVVA